MLEKKRIGKVRENLKKEREKWWGMVRVGMYTRAERKEEDKLEGG